MSKAHTEEAKMDAGLIFLIGMGVGGGLATAYWWLIKR
tara:strand:+ start:3393 stop:3506 length:114 start_codon:yes stop_codon:yes gene_type:complete